MYYEAIDTLKGMISRPSFSRDETAVADFLQQTWQAAGHSVHRKGNNLWIVSPGFDLKKPTFITELTYRYRKNRLPAGQKILSIRKRARMKNFTVSEVMMPELVWYLCIQLLPC